MKYTKTAFLFLSAAAIVAFSPSYAFALETASSGTGAGTVTAQDSGTGAGSIVIPATASTGTGALTITTPATETTGTGAGSISIPGTESTGTGAGSITIPTTQTSGTGAGAITPPATQSSGTGAGTVTPPNTETSGTGAGTPTPPPTSNGSGPVSNGNQTSPSNISVSSGGGSSVGGGGSVAIAPTTSCLLTGPLTLGSTGPEVVKLQNFLRNTEGLNVLVTATYDEQTVAAVKAFQVKYAGEILTPWGVTAPTGNVYITTLKKINSRACNTALTLTPAELAEINAYKNRVADSATVSAEVVGATTGTETPSPAVSVSPATSPDTTLVGAAAKTTVATKIWNFIKWIFGR